MKTKKYTSDATALTSTTDNFRSTRQIRIANDKARARRWAELRKLKREPLAVAQAVVQEFPPAIHQESETSHISVLRDLEHRKSLLLAEVSAIQGAIDVITRTYSR